MKKYIFAFIACLIMAFAAGAQDLSQEQLRLRKDIVIYLTDKGYKPNIDKDGDVFFTKDDVKYWVMVSKTWSDPFLVSIFTEYSYNAEKKRTKENVEGCISMVNQMKTVKLTCQKYVYTLRTSFFCKNVTVFTETFNSILAELQNANNYIVETIASGLGGEDLTGNKDAIYQKALMMYMNDDYPQAMRLFNYLAGEGYPAAYGILGLAYEHGVGVLKDEKRMIQNYEKGLESGETWCAYRLGDYYLEKNNYTKALEYFNQSCAVDNPFRSESFYKIGLMNENGNGVPKNIDLALKNYHKAVEYSTELECEGRLALIRLEEQVENPADFVDISKGMLSGLSANEMYNKGNEYENGLNNRAISLPKAYGWFKAAADRDNAKANFKMGNIFVSKYYPFKDKAKSFKYYAKAFKAFKQQESFNPEASYYLGLMYKNGLGIEENSELAISSFKKASSKGNADAYYELGLICQSELEYVEAFKYFLRAAENGVPAAMLEVAKAYENGLGTSRDKDQSIKWYRKCSNTDSPYAKEADRVMKQLRRTDDDKE